MAGEGGSLTLASATEGGFRGAGAQRIFWRSWPAVGQPRGIVTIVHGWGDHSGRYEYVGEWLSGRGYAVYALDHQGHGRSSGIRGRISFEHAISDLDRLVVLGCSYSPHVDAFVLGHSAGGAIALRYALEHEDRLSGLIVTGPLIAVEGRAFARIVAPAIGALAPWLPVAKVDPALISRKQAVVEAYACDPLVIHGRVPAATAAQFVRYAATLPNEADRLTLPALIMYGTADRICDPAGAELLAARIGSRDLTTRAYEGLYHEILNEPERDAVLEDIDAWLGAQVATRHS